MYFDLLVDRNNLRGSCSLGEVNVVLLENDLPVGRQDVDAGLCLVEDLLEACHHRCEVAGVPVWYTPLHWWCNVNLKKELN